MPADNNNLDLSTIDGSGPNTRKEKSDAAAAAEKAAKVVADATGSGAPQPPPGYDPLLDPKVKQLRDSLLSSQALVQEQLKKEQEEKTRIAAELDTFKQSQEKERLAKLSETDRLNEQFKKLADNNQALMQKLADMSVAQAQAAFEVDKSKMLAESGIPTEFHRFIGAASKDLAGFQKDLEAARETFKDVIKKSDIPPSVRTTQTGTTSPAPANHDNAGNQPSPQRLIDRLDPETAAKINFDTLPDIIHKNPKLAAELNRNLRGR